MSSDKDRCNSRLDKCALGIKGGEALAAEGATFEKISPDGSVGERCGVEDERAEN